MQFTPPLFQKFGSSADDLLKKKLEADEKHEVVIKSQSKNLLFTQTMNTQQGSFEKLEGKLNLKYEDKSWGEAVVEVNTNGKLQKDIKFTQLAPGMTVTGRVEGTVNCSTCPTPQVAIQYKQDSFAGHVEYSGKNKEVLTSAAVGYEGFSVGAMLKTNVKTIQEGSELTQAMSVDGGVQYEDRNLTGTFTLASNTLSVSLYHLLNKSTQYGGKLVASTNKGNSIAIVGQHTLSPDTMVKGKIHVCDDKTWSIGTHVEHKVVSPDLTVGVTTYYDSKRSVPAFGISAQFSSH